MAVEIKKRFCEQATAPGLAPVQKRIEQDEILVNGVRVGYVGTQPAAPVTLLLEIAEADIAAVRAAVDERDGVATPDRVVVWPPTWAAVERSLRR